MQGKRILLIEDNLDVQVFVRTVARMEGAVLVAASSGESGVERFRDGPRFDLILMDINLPGMSGWDVIDLLDPAGTQGSRLPPIVIFTASADSDTVDKAERMGARDVIVKPIAARDLVTRLNAALST